MIINDFFSINNRKTTSNIFFQIQGFAAYWFWESFRWVFFDSNWNNLKWVENFISLIFVIFQNRVIANLIFMEPDNPEKVLRQKYALFSNQTSGHSCIIKATNGFTHLLKPLDPNEQNFYETTNNRQATAFLAFLPKYFGIHWPNTQEVKYFSKLAKQLIVSLSVRSKGSLTWCV